MVPVRYILFILLSMDTLSYISSSTTVQAVNDVVLDHFTKVGDKYYLELNDLRLNWYAAVHFCRKYDSDLLAIESKAETDALFVYLKEKSSFKSAWTSGNDLSEEANYMSLNTGREMIYKNWAPNEPNNSDGKEDCVEAVLSNEGIVMNDNDCNKKFRVICEKKRLTSETLSVATPCDISQCDEDTTNCVLRKLVDEYLQSTNILSCTQSKWQRE